MKIEELDEAIKKYDSNPDNLLCLAKTRFQKQVVTEFGIRDREMSKLHAFVDKRFTLLDDKMSTIEKIAMGILIAVLIAIFKEQILLLFL